MRSIPTVFSGIDRTRLIIHTDSTVNDEILRIKDSILATVPDYEKIYLFGSYAYGTPHKDSDYDFYVVLNDACTEKALNVINRIYHNLNYTKGMYVDILSSCRNRFEDRSQLPTLERAVVNKGVLFYNRA